jgi:hypothetical protein
MKPSRSITVTVFAAAVFAASGVQIAAAHSVVRTFGNSNLGGNHA